MIKNLGQNQYGKLQRCCLCRKPLEKARVVDRGNAKCKACQKKLYKQYLINKACKETCQY